MMVLRAEKGRGGFYGIRMYGARFAWNHAQLLGADTPRGPLAGSRMRYPDRARKYTGLKHMIRV